MRGTGSVRGGGGSSGFCAMALIVGRRKRPAYQHGGKFIWNPALHLEHSTIAGQTGAQGTACHPSSARSGRGRPRSGSLFMRKDRPLADLSTSGMLSESPATRITLLARLRSPSDAEAWRTFVDLYLPLVFQYCRKRGLQDADARDVSQQVLANIHRAIETFIYDPQKGKFRNWLGTIATREITRYQHRDRRPGKGGGDGLGDWGVGQEGGEVDAAWQEEFNAHIFGAALARVKAQFDDATWQAFDATWLHDVKPSQAAKELGKQAAWVYKARFRVLERLKSELEFLTNDAAIFHRPS